MKFSATHWKRYREIAALLWKYGRSDLVEHLKVADGFDPKDVASAVADGTPEQLANDLEAMGPTYVKIGQVLAGRPDLLPDIYLKALSRLQDNVKPFPYADVERIVMEELGVRMSKAFESFDQEPIAAASLGQVHGAVLRNGRKVVVKVQRPNIRQQIAEDFEVLSEIASFLDEHTEAGRRYRFLTVLEEFRVTIQQELNYQLEAQNLVAIGRNLKEFTQIQIPQPVDDYTTRSVLTMDFVSGHKITAISPLARLDVKGGPLAEEIFRAYLKQVLIDGLFHADPHPGNVFLTDEGRIALIDLGQVGHTAPQMQESLLKLLLAVSEGKGEDAAEVVVRMSERTDTFDGAEFRRKISQLIAMRRDQGLEQMNVGTSLLDVSRNARDTGLFVPSELTLLGKTLLQLDEVGRILDPTFDPNASIRRNVSDLMSRRMKQDLSQGNIFSSLLELKDFVSALPGRLNYILDALKNNEIEIKIRALDTKNVLEGMQKIANRIATGIILGSMIVGASLLTKVQTSFTIFGYPGLAMLVFIAAGLGGAWLVGSILVQDYRTHRAMRKKG